MKKMFLLLGLGLIVFGCKKSNPNPGKSQGTIIGYDLRLCPSPMCGGLEITIKDDTAKKPPPFYKINSTLQQLGISENTAFPINVNLNWKHDTLPYGAYNYIVVSQVKIVK